jgi:hypothetical protein
VGLEARLKDDLPSDEGYVNPVSVVPPAPVVTKEEEQDLFGWVK